VLRPACPAVTLRPPLRMSVGGAEPSADYERISTPSHDESLKAAVAIR
jgi:hypothetical protein